MSVYNRPLDALLYTPHVDSEIRVELSEFQRDDYNVVAPRVVSAITSRYARDSVIFTDGSRSAGGTGFGVFHYDNFEMAYRLAEPSGVYTSELTAIFYALEHIRSHPPGRFLILSDSLSSLQALQSRKISPKVHSMVYQCKEAFWSLSRIGYAVSIAWIPSHVGICGNERVDRLAGSAALADNYLRAPPNNFDFSPLAKTRMLIEWQEKWNNSDMGRFAYSIFPTIALKPWFSKLLADRHVITKINRMISNHTCLRNHLNRIAIVESPVCECGEDYETLEHVLWACSRFREERRHLLVELNRLGTPMFVPVRDLLGDRHWNGLQICCSFFKKCGLTI
jgi:ribonuclease HI